MHVFDTVSVHYRSGAATLIFHGGYCGSWFWRLVIILCIVSFHAGSDNNPGRRIAKMEGRNFIHIPYDNPSQYHADLIIHYLNWDNSKSEEQIREYL